MDVSSIHIDGKHRLQIEADARRAYPEECCGLLVGVDEADSRLVKRVVPMTNVAPLAERRRSFKLDPLAMMDVERSLDGSGLRVVGIYHSHPDHPARPSETDRQAAWTFYSYLIVSTLQSEVTDVQSWVLEESNRSFIRQEIGG